LVPADQALDNPAPGLEVNVACENEICIARCSKPNVHRYFVQPPSCLGPPPKRQIFARIMLTCKPFRMNTCKSVSKQRALTSFRINTYKKHRGRGSWFTFFLTSLLPYFIASFPHGSRNTDHGSPAPCEESTRPRLSRSLAIAGPLSLCVILQPGYPAQRGFG
jgi:hypothetical protein